MGQKPIEGSNPFLSAAPVSQALASFGVRHPRNRRRSTRRGSVSARSGRWRSQVVQGFPSDVEPLSWLRAIAHGGHDMETMDWITLAGVAAILLFLWDIHRDIADLRERMVRLGSGGGGRGTHERRDREVVTIFRRAWKSVNPKARSGDDSDSTGSRVCRKRVDARGRRFAVSTPTGTTANPNGRPDRSAFPRRVDIPDPARRHARVADREGKKAARHPIRVR